MGKTTTANFFKQEGIPVWNADLAVHELYENDGEIIKALRKILPNAIIDDKIDRSVLRAEFSKTPELLSSWESVIHPAVAKHRERFLNTHADADIVVLDIPLIYEKNMQDQFDAVLVVSIDEAEQRRRVLARGTMTEAQFEHILAKQVPDEEKRKKADFVIETKSLSFVDQQVQDLIARIRGL